MKKSELKQLIREILTEAKTQGFSGFKKSPEKKDNTQMGRDDKNITSTDKPVEKTEGKKLPVVKKPTEPKKESSLKEALLTMVREEIEEYRTKGALGRGNAQRTTPLKTYVPKGIPGMGRPKNSDGDDDEGDGEQRIDSIISVAVNGKEVGEFDLNLKTPSGKPDMQGGAMKRHVDAFHEKNNLAEYGFFSPKVYEAFEKLSDQWVDGALAPNSILDLSVEADPASKLQTLVPRNV